MKLLEEFIPENIQLKIKGRQKLAPLAYGLNHFPEDIANAREAHKVMRRIRSQIPVMKKLSNTDFSSRYGHYVSND